METQLSKKRGCHCKNDVFNLFLFRILICAEFTGKRVGSSFFIFQKYFDYVRAKLGTMMHTSRSFIRYTAVLNIFVLSLSLVGTTTLDGELVSRVLKVSVDHHRGKTTIHGKELVDRSLKPVPYSAVLVKKATHDEQKIPGQKKTHGRQLTDKIIRTRRVLGYKMRCVPATKKVCKKMKYKGMDTIFCTKVASEKCYAID